jgi:parallel beta-helix repeat protein
MNITRLSLPTRLCVLLAAFISSFFILPSAFSQGALTPPGAPAPTMKSLDQLEPRTPISSLPFDITNSGVFFMTASLSNNLGITIDASDVTLDLGDFTLTGGGGSTGIEIRHQNRVAIRNGTIRDFFVGITLTEPLTNALIENIFTQSNSSEGILIRGTGSIIRHCRSSGGAAGFNLSRGFQNVIEDCVAINNTQTGFLIAGTNNLVIRNLASGNPLNDYNIALSNHVGTIVLSGLTTTSITNGGPGSGTTDPFANLRY